MLAAAEVITPTAVQTHPYCMSWVTQGHLLYLEHLEYLLLVLLARDARHDALARPPAAVAVV